MTVTDLAKGSEATSCKGISFNFLGYSACLQAGTVSFFAYLLRQSHLIPIRKFVVFKLHKCRGYCLKFASYTV